MHSSLQGTEQPGGALALFTGVCSLPVPQHVTVSLSRGGTAHALEHSELQLLWEGQAQPARRPRHRGAEVVVGGVDRLTGAQISLQSVELGWFSSRSVMGQDTWLRSNFLAAVRREG